MCIYKINNGYFAGGLSGEVASGLDKVEYLHIYNSVLTCRQNIINSSASAQLNATKIALKKVSDVDVCMFGPEL